MMVRKVAVHRPVTKVIAILPQIIEYSGIPRAIGKKPKGGCQGGQKNRTEPDMGCPQKGIPPFHPLSIAFINELDQHQGIVDHHPGNSDDRNKAVDCKKRSGQHGTINNTGQGKNHGGNDKQWLQIGLELGR